MRTTGFLATAFSLLFSACGGKVVVDNPSTGSGGSGSTGVGPAGSGGSTSGVGGFDAVCDAPVVAPSGGACIASGACNPVTGAPCTAMPGASCDIGAQSFECFGTTPNDQAICQSCDNVNGPFCAATLTCLSDGHCARYCCDDGDCGSGFCDLMALPGFPVGVCKKS